MNAIANLVPPSPSFASYLNGWFFSLPGFLPLLVLFLLMGGIGLAAYLSRQLTAGGSVACIVVGFGTTWVLGFGALVCLMLFFLAAGVLGKIGAARKTQVVEKIQQKGSCRDSLQVFANGGMALFAALLYGFFPSGLALVMFGAAVAEAASDTFAGEVGILSKVPPVSIVTGRPMKPGLSGAISPLGSIAGFLGSALIALCWLGNFLPFSGRNVAYASVVVLGGFAGCLFDSFLGATVQAHYYDEETDSVTEHRTVDGRMLPLCKGVRWVDNDTVNLFSNIFGALLAGGLSLAIR
jgi:uncharacterized protein (TIGR00297 family)